MFMCIYYLFVLYSSDYVLLYTQTNKQTNFINFLMIIVVNDFPYFHVFPLLFRVSL